GKNCGEYERPGRSELIGRERPRRDSRENCGFEHMGSTSVLEAYGRVQRRRIGCPHDGSSCGASHCNSLIHSQLHASRRGGSSRHASWKSGGSNLKRNKLLRRIAVIGIAATLSCLSLVQAQERDGELTFLRGAAEEGDSAAQFTLANPYYRGLGVQQDS